ncbi:Hypothetical protein I5071_22780 [Sandaracinus amylolyticus]|nr:Hypothetical protein I5071_22780 [Sandaracinus amylolyticus]
MRARGIAPSLVLASCRSRTGETSGSGVSASHAKRASRTVHARWGVVRPSLRDRSGAMPRALLHGVGMHGRDAAVWALGGLAERAIPRSGIARSGIGAALRASVPNDRRRASRERAEWVGAALRASVPSAASAADGKVRGVAGDAEGVLEGAVGHCPRGRGYGNVPRAVAREAEGYGNVSAGDCPRGRGVLEGAVGHCPRGRGVREVPRGIAREAEGYGKVPSGVAGRALAHGASCANARDALAGAPEGSARHFRGALVRRTVRRGISTPRWCAGRYGAAFPRRAGAPEGTARHFRGALVRRTVRRGISAARWCAGRYGAAFPRCAGAPDGPVRHSTPRWRAGRSRGAPGDLQAASSSAPVEPVVFGVAGFSGAGFTGTGRPKLYRRKSRKNPNGFGSFLFWIRARTL